MVKWIYNINDEIRAINDEEEIYIELVDLSFGLTDRYPTMTGRWSRIIGDNRTGFALSVRAATWRK